MKQNTDRITSLPADITNQILSALPLKDAINTSALSRYWRYKWTEIPHLVFDDGCVCITSVQDETKFIRFVDRVLLRHNGPIHKFKLSRKKIKGTSDIDQWILHITKYIKSVQEFTLDNWLVERYKVPTRFFYLENLTHLELLNCELKFPSNFKGFKSLKILDLQLSTLSQDGFENLIINCQLLERVTLINVDGNLPSRLPCLCTNVKYFRTNMDFNDLDKSLVALCLLRNFPNLEELDIWALDKKTSTGTLFDSKNMGEHWNCMIGKLRVVNISRISGTSSELDFIKFILWNSPMLEKMTIKPLSADGGLELLKKVVRFPRVSTAEIIYLDP